MPDLATLGAALSSLKAATDIVIFLRKSDFSLERAELKLKFAELASSLVDAKIELAEVQEALVKKDKRIEELEEAFQSKDSLVREYDAYYALDQKGRAIGVPFCLSCWENEHKKRQLVKDAKEFQVSVCTSCKQRYDSRGVFTKEPPADG